MIRPATTDDVAEVAALWVTAQPYRVVTAAGLLASYEHRDPGVDVSHQVAVQNGRVVGEAGLRLWTDARGPRARISVVVHPDARRRGVGTALLTDAVAAARAHGATVLQGIADPGPGLAFAEAHGARRMRPHTVNGCDPAQAPPPGPTPAGLRVLAADRLPDVEPVRALFNDTAPDDPSGLSEQMSKPEFARFWHAPDHRPELGAVVLADDRLLAVTSTLADLERGQAWTGMTATSAQARGRGLARLVKTHALRAMATVGIRQVATGNDDANAAMLAVNVRLGYSPLATVWSVALPL